MIEWNRVTWYSKLLALILFIVIFTGGFYLGTRSDELQGLFPRNEGVACTTEARVCSDGSTVGRTGPNCEFPACSSTNENTGNDAGAIDIPGDFVPQ